MIQPGKAGGYSDRKVVKKKKLIKTKTTVRKLLLKKKSIYQIPLPKAGCDTKSFNKIAMGLFLSFLSPRLVAIPKIANLFRSIIYYDEDKCMPSRTISFRS